MYLCLNVWTHVHIWEHIHVVCMHMWMPEADIGYFSLLLSFSTESGSLVSLSDLELLILVSLADSIARESFTSTSPTRQVGYHADRLYMGSGYLSTSPQICGISMLHISTYSHALKLLMRIGYSSDMSNFYSNNKPVPLWTLITTSTGFFGKQITDLQVWPDFSMV